MGGGGLIKYPNNRNKKVKVYQITGISEKKNIAITDACNKKFRVKNLQITNVKEKRNLKIIQTPRIINIYHKTEGCRTHCCLIMRSSI